MTHHIKHRTPSPILDRPDCAGEWEFSGGYIKRVIGSGLYEWGWWERIFTTAKHVLVTETPAGVRLCRELGMGGSMHCGLAPWSGRWRKV